MNDLQEQIEKKLVTKTFHVSAMPEAFWKEIDTFCKESYGDVRWLMIKDLFENAKRDYRFELLYDEIQALKAELAEAKKSQEDPRKQNGLPTFG